MSESHVPNGKSPRRSTTDSQPALAAEIVVPPTPDRISRPNFKRGKVPCLDEVRRAEICAIVAVGCSLTTAAKYVGCSPCTIDRTRKRSPEFEEELRKSEAHHELALVRRIHEAAAKPNGWRAASWLLSRRYPELYSHRGAETVTPRQIAESLEYFAAEIAEEVTSASLRRRITTKLRKTVRKITSELRKQAGG